MNRLCPMCGNRTEEARCPQDGTATLVLAQNPDSRLTEGTEVNGRYRIGAMIGQGGFGAVYRATSLTTGQAMAVKVLGVSLDSDESELIQRFFAEAQITAGLKHPNTIRVFDFGQTEGGALYIAMELLSGQALNELLRERRKKGSALTQAETLNVASQTLRSLTEAHMSGLVHRDLKPHNIFLNDVPGDDPVVKVLDFGIAKRLGSNLTGTGQAFGTPTYMSPEQAQNRQIDARSDLYSLGVVLYQCVAGACPFEGDNPLAVLLSHVTDKPADLYSRAANPVSREFASLIERALEKDPNDRFDGAVEMRRALEGCERAPSEEDWQKQKVVVTGDDARTVDTDERTAAYRPVARTKANGPANQAPPAAVPAEQADGEGGSGFTQAFMNRGVAADVAVAEMANAAGADPSLPSGGSGAVYDDSPVPKPKGGAGKWIVLLLLLLALGAGGAWAVLSGAFGAGNSGEEADAGATPVSADASVETDTHTAAGEPDAGATADVPNDVAAQQADSATAQAAAPDTAPAAPVAARVLLDSEPQGASLQIDGKPHGKTPHTLLVEPGTPLRVSLRLKGYRGTEVLLVDKDAPKRMVKLTKLATARRPRPVRRPRPEPSKPKRPKVKSALEERL